MKIVILFSIFLILLILMILLNKFFNKNRKSVEKFFCKTPKYNPRGALNDKRVYLEYEAQSNIRTQPCSKYWYKEPVEYNNSQIDQSPVVIYEEQLELPPDKDFGSNAYEKGLIMYTNIIKLINDEIDFDIFDKCEELLIDPLTKNKIQYQYQLHYEIDILNKKTEINRWQKFNPSIEKVFSYEEIKSPINDINILNNEFKLRFDIKQKYALDKNQLLNTGIVPFQIFKYKILSILYKDKNPDKPVYIMQISFFRETDLYINTFSYIGYIDNQINSDSSSKAILTNIKYIGVNSTDQELMAPAFDNNEITNEIINPNFSNKVEIEKDPDAIVAIAKKTRESYKLKNQWGCFNINPNSENILLPYFSRASCESSLDPFGRAKDVGIYDKPCNSNEECPFYKANKNYENELGKCLPNGYCELPINMKRIGYKYFVSDKLNAPLCYNCESNNYEYSTLIDKCCIQQQNKNKYPFLKSPDYSFENDQIARMNDYNKNNCTEKIGTFDIKCN